MEWSVFALDKHATMIWSRNKNKNAIVACMRTCHACSIDFDLITKNNGPSKTKKRNSIYQVCIFRAFFMTLSQSFSAKGRRRGSPPACVHPTICPSLHVTPLSRLIPIVQGWQIVQSNTLHVGKNLKSGNYFNKASLSFQKKKKQSLSLSLSELEALDLSVCSCTSTTYTLGLLLLHSPLLQTQEAKVAKPAATKPPSPTSPQVLGLGIRSCPLIRHPCIWLPQVIIKGKPPISSLCLCMQLGPNPQLVGVLLLLADHLSHLFFSKSPTPTHPPTTSRLAIYICLAIYMHL